MTDMRKVPHCSSISFIFKKTEFRFFISMFAVVVIIINSGEQSYNDAIHQYLEKRFNRHFSPAIIVWCVVYLCTEAASIMENMIANFFI